MWPDSQLGPLGPQDRRFPLPGLVGPMPEGAPVTVQPAKPLPDLLTEPLASDRHLLVLQNYMKTAQEVADQREAEFSAEPTPSALDTLECVAQDCPQTVRKDFQELFPDRCLGEGPLTVISISQHTDNDMAGWNPEVEVEREQLLQHFVCGAEEICQSLQRAGYWADFIEPSSGRPYFGSYTNATLFETDERYRHLGFDIDDLGCCKVIRHHLWGTHAYVSCLFTSAPVDIVNRIVNTQQDAL